MPFALLIVGLVLVVSSVRNTVTQGDPNLVGMLKSDFTGQNNFSYWLISILIIGALGYIPAFRSLSRAFLALVVIVLLISHGGFFSQFNLQAFGNNTSSGSTSL